MSDVPTTSSPTPRITLYTGQSPNGIKISIALEELGLAYNVYKLDMKTQEQKMPWFIKINPNGRIPAITDKLPDGSGEINVWESGAILQYLVHRYDKDHRISYPAGTTEWVQMTCWLHFQMSGLGPMQGQANHFIRYSSEKNEYGITRYATETRRLYKTMDDHLAESGSPYFVGSKCTIADISMWGWVSVSRWCKIELSEFPALQAWEERMLKRPALEKGRHVPDPHHREMLMEGDKAIEAFEARAKEFVKDAYKNDAERQEKYKLENMVK